MHISNNHLPRSKWIFYSLFLPLLLSLSNFATAGECYKKRIDDCRDYRESREYYGGGNCPCFSSASQLQRALGNNTPPNICRSSKTYSVLSGGTLTFTSQEYGNAFSCYFQNINRKTKNEVVEYGTQQEVLNMHLACDAIIKDFARANNIKCNK